MSEAPNNLWLHKLTEQVDEPYQWQLTERRIDKHSVRYVLADKYVTLEAALGVQEMKDKRIAELEAENQRLRHDILHPGRRYSSSTNTAERGT